MLKDDTGMKGKDRTWESKDKKKKENLNKIKAGHQKWHFSELTHTYTIRDYSFDLHTMLVYDKTLQCWPSGDSIHMENSTHVATACASSKV